MIQISKKAGKQLTKIDTRYRAKVFKAIHTLPAGDVVKLAGSQHRYRLRVGFLRILFEMTAGNIVIYKIEKRGDAYQ